ncbi:hypothetical protein ESY86_06980 [Subsaximicrobium wynnwilliamsii]|uniref:Uncharacterized protein n=1 Tax=Subsaximicrobium wynnwilliamsii TaxID=291179 RepID=A0A5C6ZJG3_9FLAO|nr:hypothetical protein [Subsaximicrobium wynnwilliamsii]TXD81574.1 hypothetical protein ESY87_17595 [Subsaximicrobium wynnwilliamsii]TXD89936.1 hypothetical protein ESY86_06980 [Subsaximicrobium wynnwilliamsii]TXE01035.1 hypothetical protein ESY88_17590 [Subsaximicrobium wynnwilliamsii]
MADEKKIKNKDFDPGKDTDLEKGPLKSKHENAFGTRGKGSEKRDLSQDIPKKPGKSDTDAKS